MVAEEAELPKMTPMDHSKFGTYGGATPVRGHDRDAAPLGYPTDPYYWYMRLPNFKENFQKAMQPGYSSWEMFGRLTGYGVSLHEKLQRRDEPVNDGVRPYGDPLISMLRWDRTYFPNVTVERHMRLR